MRIRVNGEEVTIGEGCTLGRYLTLSGLDPATVVVEKNGDIVPGANFATEPLEEGDSLEVLHFVGGG